MKSHLKFTEENIGNIVYIKTTDDFSCEGEIKVVTDTIIEVKDLKTKNTYTIFPFEIKEFENLKDDKSNNKKNNVIKSPSSVETKHLSTYDHPIFGRLNRGDKILRFSNHNDMFEKFCPVYKKQADLYDCKYVKVDNQNSIYMNAARYFENYRTIGVSFYHDEEGIGSGYKFLTISCDNLDLIIDVNGITGAEFRVKYAAVATMLTSGEYLKVIFCSNRLYHSLKAILEVELNHFMDLQILYYGIHSIRLAEKFKAKKTYSNMVRLLFNATFKVKNNAFYVEDEVVHKMAFNAHFMVPIYEFMMDRITEPVRLLSRRICYLDSDAVNDSDVAANLNVGNSAEVDFDILPRSFQFWTYRDTSALLQAKKAIDRDMQIERQAGSNGAGGAVCDVVQIKKNLARKFEMENADQDNYYEDISDNDDEASINKLEVTQHQTVVHKVGNHRDDCYDDQEDKQEQPLHDLSPHWRQDNEGLLQAIRRTRVMQLEQPAHDTDHPVRQQAPPIKCQVPVASRLGLGRGRGILKKVANGDLVKFGLVASTAAGAGEADGRAGGGWWPGGRSSIDGDEDGNTGNHTAHQQQQQQQQHDTWRQQATCMDRPHGTDCHNGKTASTSSSRDQLPRHGTTSTTSTTRPTSTSTATATNHHHNNSSNGTDNNGPRRELQRREQTDQSIGTIEDDIFNHSNFLTSTRYLQSPTTPSNGGTMNRRTTGTPHVHQHHQHNQHQVGRVASSGGSEASMDHRPNKPLSKGRGTSPMAPSAANRSGRAWKSTSQCSSVDNGGQDDGNGDTDYCELSARHWHNSRANSGPMLCLDKFSRQHNFSNFNSNNSGNSNQAIGIIWNALAVDKDRETEELYEQLGLN